MAQELEIPSYPGPAAAAPEKKGFMGSFFEKLKKKKKEPKAEQTDLKPATKPEPKIQDKPAAKNEPVPLDAKSLEKEIERINKDIDKINKELGKAK